MLETRGPQPRSKAVLFSTALGFKTLTREADYGWIAGELVRLGYARPGKADRGVIQRYQGELKSLPEADPDLKPGITFEQLERIAYSIGDNDAVQRLNQARAERFRAINKTQARPPEGVYWSPSFRLFSGLERTASHGPGPGLTRSACVEQAG